MFVSYLDLRLLERRLFPLRKFMKSITLRLVFGFAQYLSSALRNLNFKVQISLKY